MFFCVSARVCAWLDARRRGGWRVRDGAEAHGPERKPTGPTHPPYISIAMGFFKIFQACFLGANRKGARPADRGRGGPEDAGTVGTF